MLTVTEEGLKLLYKLPAYKGIDMIVALGEAGCRLGIQQRRLMKSYLLGINYNSDIVSQEYDNIILLGTKGNGRDLRVGRERVSKDKETLYNIVKTMVYPANYDFRKKILIMESVTFYDYCIQKFDEGTEKYDALQADLSEKLKLVDDPEFKKYFFEEEYKKKLAKTDDPLYKAYCTKLFGEDATRLNFMMGDSSEKNKLINSDGFKEFFFDNLNLISKRYDISREIKRVVFVTALGGSSGSALVEVFLEIGASLGWEILPILVMPLDTEVFPERGNAITVLNGIIQNYMTANNHVKAVFIADNTYLTVKKFQPNGSDVWGKANAGIAANLYELTMLPYLTRRFMVNYNQVTGKTLDRSFNVIDEDEIMRVLYKGNGFYDMRELVIEDKWLPLFTGIFKHTVLSDLKQYVEQSTDIPEDLRVALLKATSLNQVSEAALRYVSPANMSLFFDGHKMSSAKKVLCCCCIPARLVDYDYVMRLVTTVFYSFNRSTMNCERFDRTCVSDYFKEFTVKIVLGGLPTPAKIPKLLDGWVSSKASYDKKETVKPIVVPDNVDLLSL